DCPPVGSVVASAGRPSYCSRGGRACQSPPGESMRPLRSLSAALTIVLCAAAQPGRAEDKPAVGDEKLRQELLRRMREDQDVRKKLIPILSARKGPVKEADLPPELRGMGEIDKRNTAWLKGVINRRGWPGKSLVGADGANAAWLLVQHAD